MKELSYLRPRSPEEAVAAVSGNPHAVFLGGGTNLVDHLKLGVATPDVVVDVHRLPLDTVETYAADGTGTEGGDREGGGLRIGTNVLNSDLAAHPLLRSRWPVVSRALLAGASGQIRNQATTGGNLLQRTRCVYFQDTSTPCNKRQPGSGCSAIGGYDRYNAVLGTDESCVATHPSDLAVALACVDARVVVLGPTGVRRVPVADLHRLPGHHPERDTVLEHGELITAVELPEAGAAPVSTYYKARDRASYAFALVSVAAALRLVDGVVDDVRIAWGGMAHKPWRARAAEAALRGGPIDEDTLREAVDAELRDVVTSAGNAFKPAMIRGATTLTLTRLARTAGAAGTEEDA